MMYLEDRGYEPHIPKDSGLRSPAQQAAKVAAGVSKVKVSAHNFGMAADIVDVRWLWGEYPESPWLGRPAYENYWAHLRYAAEDVGLGWGGHFDSDYGMGWDPAHVEVPGWRSLIAR